MLTPVQAVLLDALRYLRYYGPDANDGGICMNVESIVDAERVFVSAEVWQLVHEANDQDEDSWDEIDPAYLVYQELGATFVALGMDVAYPLGGPDEGRLLYGNGIRTGLMWDRNTEYGRARWALLDQVINHLEAQA